MVICLSVAGTAEWSVIRLAMWEDTKDGRLLVELISAACHEGSWMEQGDRAARETSEDITFQALSNIFY